MARLWCGVRATHEPLQTSGLLEADHRASPRAGRGHMPTLPSILR